MFDFLKKIKQPGENVPKLQIMLRKLLVKIIEGQGPRIEANDLASILVHTGSVDDCGELMLAIAFMMDHCSDAPVAIFKLLKIVYAALVKARATFLPAAQAFAPEIQTLTYLSFKKQEAGYREHVHFLSRAIYKHIIFGAELPEPQMFQIETFINEIPTPNISNNPKQQETPQILEKNQLQQNILSSMLDWNDDQDDLIPNSVQSSTDDQNLVDLAPVNTPQQEPQLLGEITDENQKPRIPAAFAQLASENLLDLDAPPAGHEEFGGGLLFDDYISPTTNIQPAKKKDPSAELLDQFLHDPADNIDNIPFAKQIDQVHDSDFAPIGSSDNAELIDDFTSMPSGSNQGFIDPSSQFISLNSGDGSAAFSDFNSNLSQTNQNNNFDNDLINSNDLLNQHPHDGFQSISSNDNNVFGLADPLGLNQMSNSQQTPASKPEDSLFDAFGADQSGPLPTIQEENSFDPFDNIPAKSQQPMQQYKLNPSQDNTFDPFIDISANSNPVKTEIKPSNDSTFDPFDSIPVKQPEIPVKTENKFASNDTFDPFDSIAQKPVNTSNKPTVGDAFDPFTNIPANSPVSSPKKEIKASNDSTFDPFTAIPANTTPTPTNSEIKKSNDAIFDPFTNIPSKVTTNVVNTPVNEDEFDPRIPAISKPVNQATTPAKSAVKTSNDAVFDPFTNIPSKTTNDDEFDPRIPKSTNTPVQTPSKPQSGDVFDQFVSISTNSANSTQNNANDDTFDPFVSIPANQTTQNSSNTSPVTNEIKQNHNSGFDPLFPVVKQDPNTPPNIFDPFEKVSPKSPPSSSFEPINPKKTDSFVKINQPSNDQFSALAPANEPFDPFVSIKPAETFDPIGKPKTNPQAEVFDPFTKVLPRSNSTPNKDKNIDLFAEPPPPKQPSLNSFAPIGQVVHRSPSNEQVYDPFTQDPPPARLKPEISKNSRTSSQLYDPIESVKSTAKKSTFEPLTTPNRPQQGSRDIFDSIAGSPKVSGVFDPFESPSTAPTSVKNDVLDSFSPMIQRSSSANVKTPANRSNNGFDPFSVTVTPTQQQPQQQKGFGASPKPQNSHDIFDLIVSPSQQQPVSASKQTDLYDPFGSKQASKGGNIPLVRQSSGGSNELFDPITPSDHSNHNQIHIQPQNNPPASAITISGRFQIQRTSSKASVDSFIVPSSNLSTPSNMQKTQQKPAQNVFDFI